MERKGKKPNPPVEQTFKLDLWQLRKLGRREFNGSDARAQNPQGRNHSLRENRNFSSNRLCSFGSISMSITLNHLNAPR